AQRVTRKIINAEFAIWQDIKNLRTGQRWDDRIGEAVRQSRVFIILMTPKWFESTFCRKEYQIFKELEDGGVGEYVVPILTHEIENQLRHFDPEQRAAYDELRERQHRKVIAVDFLALTPDQREVLVDNIADDIEGMIQRLRSPPAVGVDRTPMTRPVKRAPEFRANPHLYPKYDFLTAGEILVEPPKGQAMRGVFVHLGFLERLYVKTEDGSGSVEFSIRRADLSFDDGGAGKLGRNPAWEKFSTRDPVYYVSRPATPKAVTICINPQPGRTGISDLPLPPAEHENYLSMPAIAAPDIDLSSIRAELTVSLCPEGLFIAGENPKRPSPDFARKIAAIMSVKVARSDTAGSPDMRRDVPVREKSL
ncbi:toll/interleukin-1 receptor domain-containing protein, partial [Bradyrhizobium sp.]|uniref:toll/interleukin-1 receptor domain-containing protein n=1 Tax=Bradyrhizobium sp. TaxID=376 RepID=UPI003C26D05C